VVVERPDERVPDAGERHTVLGALGSGERGLDRGQVELEDLGEGGLVVAVVAEQALGLRVAIHQIDAVSAPREPQVGERLLVHREIGGGGAVLRAHVRQRGAIGDRQARKPRAEELAEALRRQAIFDEISIEPLDPIAQPG